MKKLLTICTCILLAGCATGVPVMMTFPEVPAELKSACPDLGRVDPKTDKLSDVLTVVTDNYTLYHECRLKIDSWIDWYATQKNIFDKVGK
jgi:hypothetical protein